jgi:hypothetical protein
MRTRTQNKVIGTTSEAGFHHGQQERAQEELQVFDSATVKWEHTTRGMRAHAKVPFAGKGGWDWASPPGYDQSNSYSTGEAVIVDSDNDAVTDGVNSGTDFAQPGKFLCVRPVSGADPTNIKPPKAEPDPATDGGGNWLDTVYWVQIGGGTCNLYG